MGNISCMNPQPFNQPEQIQSSPQQSQQNSNLAAGIDFINFLQQRVQSKFFQQFKPQKGIQQYVGIPLQNLSQLYNFVKNIKNYDLDFDNLSQKSKKSVQTDIKKDCEVIIDEVKSTLFDLKKNTKKNVKLLKLNQTSNQKNHINIPFYLPWISAPNGEVCIYIGQWQYQSNYLEKNFPSGIGRLYLGTQIWQGQIQCSLQKIQQKDIGEVQSIKERINNQSTPIKQKILLLKNNCILNLQGLGRKFTKEEEYCGHFQNGNLNSKGQYKNYPLQYSYQGLWVDGFKDGKGIQKTKLTHYEGQFKKNKKNGQGTLIFYLSTQQQRQRLKQQKQFDETLPDLPEYKQRKKRVKIQMNLQQKSDQMIHKILQSQIPNYKGQELLMISNKSYNLWSVQQFPFINQGFIQNLKFEQSMKVNFLQKYVGDFLNDQYHGKGVYQWSKGNFYVGDWVEGKMEGQGKFYWKQGYSYYGEYKNDLKHGKGEMKWDPYKRHRGNWAFGKKHGYGEQIKIQIRQDTLGVSIKSGLWRNNTLNQRDIYFQKFFSFPDNSLQTTFFLSNIEFYYSKLKLSPELKKKLFDEKSKKFYKNPCEICGSYFLKIQEDQNEENIWKININKKDDDEIQPELCRQCQKKMQNKSQHNSQKNKDNQKTISGWFQN